MKLMDELKEQASNKNKEISECGLACLAIGNKLKELDDGHIWSREWNVLVKLGRVAGKSLGTKGFYRPTKIGEIFLKGIGYKELKQ